MALQHWPDPAAIGDAEATRPGSAAAHGKMGTKSQATLRIAQMML